MVRLRDFYLAEIIILMKFSCPIRAFHGMTDVDKNDVDFSTGINDDN